MDAAGTRVRNPLSPPRSRADFRLDLGRNIALAMVYLVLGKLGLRLAYENESVTAVWPPTGIALAAVLLLGYRVWPGIFLGAFLVNITTNGSIPASSAMALGNTLEPLLGAWLVTRFAGGCHTFDRAGTLLGFIVLAGMLSTTVSATFGVTTLAVAGLAHWSEYQSVWLTWWLGDMISAILITPLLLTWFAPPPPLRLPRLPEVIGLACALALVGAIVFSGVFSPYVAQGRSFLCMPPLLWAAFRFGQRGAISAAFVLSGIALWGTLHGYGPFVSPRPNESLLLLQAFMGTITATNLVLGAVVTEHRRADFDLRESERRLAGNLAISRLLAESPATGDALPRVLETICRSLSWELGAIWSLADGGGLRCLKVWHEPTAKMGEFEAASCSRAFTPGVGLPGRVWAVGRPVWIPDVTKDDNFPRAPDALAAGLRSAFGFPILSGSTTVAVMEFFSREIRQPDAALLEMFTGIGSQIGQFLDRRQAQEELARHRDQLEGLVKERTADLEASQERLRLAERMAAIGTLAAGLGHDMGNLLMPLRVRVETLEGLDLPDPAAENLAGIRSTVGYLQKLAGGLRTLSLDPRVKRGVEATDLRTWWEEARPVLRNLLPRAVRLDGSMPAGECWVGIGKAALTQVVFNLVQNAGQALKGEAGIVTITVEPVVAPGGPEPAAVRLRVVDNGPGMTEEVRRRCMEPFFTTQPRGISTGLGLALVYGMVREAGGDVALESAPGKGTTFTLTLPGACAPQETGQRRKAAVRLADPRLKALVVAELRHLSFDVEAGDAGERSLNGAELVVTDRPGPEHRESGPRRFVLVGDLDGEAGDGVFVLGSKPRPKDLYAALRAAARV